MPTELHPEHFKMGVILNLLMLNASQLAIMEHGPNTPLDDNQARAIAGEAFGIVTRNFLVFDDDKGTLAAAYGKTRDTLVEAVTHALIAG